MSCVLNSGVSGPSFGLMSTMTLDVCPLVSSLTCSWYAELGPGAQMCTSTLSSACMTNGALPVATVSMPLNAAGSAICFPCFASVQTGEQAVYTSGACTREKLRVDPQFLVNESG